MEKKMIALGEGEKLAKLKLHQQKASLYTQLFNSEDDVKYRKKMLKEYEFIFNIAFDLKSLDIALQSIAKIIKVYSKLSESSKVEEWKKKEKEVKNFYSTLPAVIINKIKKIEKDIKELTEDITHDELKSAELHIEVLNFYEQLCKSEVDNEYHEKYADHLKIVVRQLYNQKSFDKALSYIKKLIETCKYLGRDEEAKRHIEAENKLVNLFSQPGGTGSSTPTGGTPRDKNFYRDSLEKTPSCYPTPQKAFEAADPRAVKYHISRDQLSPNTMSKGIRGFCDMGQLERLKRIMKVVPEIDFFDEDGNLPIHLATISGHKDLVELLVNDKNERMNSKTKSGKSVLELAIENNRNDIIELLIRKGVDVNMKTSDDIEPIVFALQR